MLVVGANLAIDRTLFVDRLELGHVQRPRRAEVTPGGKAVNVCRAAAALGVRARLVANLPGRFGALVGDLLAEEGHDVHRVPTAGEIRGAVIVIEDDRRVTVLNEPGPPLRTEGVRQLRQAVQDEITNHRIVVVSGSLPPEAPADLYGTITALAQAAGAQIIVDAARDALRMCLPYKPNLVAPNLAEAHAVLGGHGNEAVEADHDAPAQATEAATALRHAGARAAVVTAGRHGVAGADESGTFWVDAPSVDVVNPIGAGDAFTAGLAVALERGADLREAVPFAVAVGSASVAHPLAGALDPDLVQRLVSA